MPKIHLGILAVIACGTAVAHANTEADTVCHRNADNTVQCQTAQPSPRQILTQNGHECVKDHATGLVWEQKTNDHSVRHYNNVYAWYVPNAKANGGNAGNDNDGHNIHAHISKLNAMNYCGHNDWRMPNVTELRSLVNFGKTGLTIDPIFAHSLPYYYWTGSPDASHKDYAWVINFYNGDDNYYNKSESHYVRAVRSDNK